MKHRDLGCAARPATTPGIERPVPGIVYKGHTSALCLPGSKTMRTCYEITQPPAFPADAPTPASNLPFQPIKCTVSTVRIFEHKPFVKLFDALCIILDVIFDSNVSLSVFRIAR